MALERAVEGTAEDISMVVGMRKRNAKRAADISIEFRAAR